MTEPAQPSTLAPTLLLSMPQLNDPNFKQDRKSVV